MRPGAAADVDFYLFNGYIVVDVLFVLQVKCIPYYKRIEICMNVSIGDAIYFQQTMWFVACNDELFYIFNLIFD